MDAETAELPPASEAEKDARLNRQTQYPRATISLLLTSFILASTATILFYQHVTGEDTTVPTNEYGPDDHEDLTTNPPDTADATPTTPSLRPKSNRTVCDTEDCQFMRWLLHVSLDRSKDPCENFHSFVCTGIQQKFPWWFTPQTGAPMYMLALIQQNLTTEVVKHLYQTPAPTEKQTAFEKARALFQHCAAERDGKRNTDVFINFLQHHDLLLTEQMTFDPLDKMVEFMFRLYIPLFFRIRLLLSRKAGAYSIFLARRRVRRGASLRLRPNMDYGQYVDRVLRTAGVTENRNDSLVDGIVAAEQLVVEYSETLPSRGFLYEVPFSQMGFLTNDTSFATQWVTATGRYTGGGLRGNATTRVSNVSIELLRALFGDASPVNGTTLRLYMAWTTVHVLANSGMLIEKATIGSCWGYAFLMFPYAAVSEVLFKTANESRIRAVRRIMKQIFFEVGKSFHKSEWIDEATRQGALMKHGLMRTSFGYVPGLDSSAVLDDRLKLYPDVRGPFLADVISIRTADNVAYIDYVFTSVIEGKESGPTLRDIFSVNAFYSKDSNEIYASPTISYRPMFTYGGPPEVNYGAIGRVLAHEMMHAFDLDGRVYDGYGRPNNWWTNSSERAYLERLRCQNESIERAPKERRLDDYPDEYLADSMGAETLFRAYKKASEASNVDLGDVGGLTKDQIFYVVSCLMWCGRNVPNPSHPPLDDRCNVPLMNTVHFSEAFSCPVDSPMNPRQKCHFW